MTTRCVSPCIDKRWLKTSTAAKREAQRQADHRAKEVFGPFASAVATGRTFHDSTDWVFEFEMQGGDS